MSSTNVRFKSVQPFYDKERWGYKPNTIRKVDMQDERFVRLNQWQGEDLEITIVNAFSPEESFTRQVTDVSFWEGFCIISWRHE